MGLAETMGGPGLFILSFLDSSFLSFPEVVDVLMIGLASGAWAQLVVHHPLLEHLTAVEINDGYLEIIRRWWGHPASARTSRPRRDQQPSRQ